MDLFIEYILHALSKNGLKIGNDISEDDMVALGLIEVFGINTYESCYRTEVDVVK